jgi:hypothetical protein
MYKAKRADSREVIAGDRGRINNKGGYEMAMSQFAVLIDQVSDPHVYPLSSVMLRAKLFAARLKSRKFRDWVNLELEGYPNCFASVESGRKPRSG